jgi:hypothetical protein
MKTFLSNNQLIDNILKPVVTEYLKHCKSNKAVTLKDIYGLNFWLKLSLLERRRFGFRFWSTRKTLGFKKTGEKRGKANLYIRIN